MRLFRPLFLLAFSVLTLNVFAADALPQLGREYTVLPQTQLVESGKKIEVTEFFGYFCPGCSAFEPHLAEWVKKQGDRIILKRVHVNFHDLVTQQKLYYTLEAMGKTEELHVKAFHAYHLERMRLTTDEEVLKFVLKQGLDKQKFLDIYHSFSIQSKLSRATQMMAAYRINSIPTIAIDGRYLTSPADVASKSRNAAPGSGHPGLQVMDWLVDKAIKEKR